MIHSILVANLEGNIIFSRYFGEEEHQYETRAAWEKKLFLATRSQWEDSFPRKLQLSISGSKFIVFSGINGLLFFVTGTEEDDELILSETMQGVYDIFLHVTKGKINEERIIDKYSKLCLYMDEIVQNGHLEFTSINDIQPLTKLTLPN